MNIGISLAERGLLPDGIVRMGIRKLLDDRLRTEAKRRPNLSEWISTCQDSPIAIEQAAANEQHYEVPAAFYQKVLGKHLKYSSCWFEAGDDLDQAEDRMLALSCERAQLSDGQDILEIGCGWGSLSLYMARHYPNSRIIGISNSNSQREHIMGIAQQEGLGNLTIRTADITHYQHDVSVDRIVSIECFEHLRNYELLFERMSDWLKPDGMAFVHVFCHRTFAYPFEDEGDDDWMSRHFFTGGQMPSFDLFSHFDQHLQVEESWEVNGQHYAATAKAWLDRIDAVDDLSELFPGVDTQQAKLMYRRWRIFFMACEELFAYDNGNEWFVGHYRFRPAAQAALVA